MPQITVHVTFDDVNGRDADVTVVTELFAGSVIPEVAREAAETAAREAWQRAVPRLEPVTLNLDGTARRTPSTGNPQSF
jgi:hypothetical protein